MNTSRKRKTAGPMADRLATLQVSLALRVAALSFEELVQLLRALTWENFQVLIRVACPDVADASESDLYQACEDLHVRLKAQLTVIAIPYWHVGTA